MDNPTVKSRVFFTTVTSLILGGVIAISLSPTSTFDHSQKLDQLNKRSQSLENKLSDISNLLNQLIEQDKPDNLIVKLDSPDAESITLSSLKSILKEIIYEHPLQAIQNNIASNEDTSKAWELVSQAQSTDITVNFFQSEEVNALPAKQKELVVSEIIGMMNRGEIDADHFFSMQ